MNFDRPLLQFSSRVNNEEIKSLLAPFLGPDELSPEQLQSVSAYLELLLKWNARMNLTAIRDPQEIVTRHFGESFFAARHIQRSAAVAKSAVDFGSGAGFPGLPLKIRWPEIELTLIESNQKKAVFLREVARSLALESVRVFSRRAEGSDLKADIVTMRAVDRFEASLPIAAKMATNDGVLCLLIGSSQIGAAQAALPTLSWQSPIAIPSSNQRVLLLGQKA